MNSTLQSIRTAIMDYLEVIHREKLANDCFEEATIEQLRKSSRFLGDLIKARQLREALMCWMSNSTIPKDPNVYNRLFLEYKNDIFWKIMNKKDTLPPIGNIKEMQAEAATAAKTAAITA